jgi:uncharacterized protein
MFARMDGCAVVNSCEQRINKSVIMLIPTREQCLRLMEKKRMPAHIQQHSFKVAQIAVYLGVQLNLQGARLKLPLLEAGGLLHDIAKEHCLRTGENHAAVGGAMVSELGYPSLAPIVEQHISIDPADLDRPFREALIVNYADKRVKHAEVVSLEQRFGDLTERYGHTEERKARIQRNLDLFLQLESKIFGGLSFRPDQVMPAAGHPYQNA